MRKFTLFLSLLFVAVMATMAATDDATLTKREVVLTTEAGMPGYISSPHDHALINPNSEWDQGGVAAMIDGDVSTHFHTAWENVPEGPHYFKIDLGEGNSASKLCFDYVSRQEASDDYPSQFAIKGSNDGVNYTLIADVNMGRSIAWGASYSSEIIGGDMAYRYLRFEVTKTVNGFQAEYYRVYFHVAEFKLFVFEDSTVEPEPEPTPEPELKPLEIVTVTPTECVASLEMITIEFNDEIAGTYDENAMSQIYLGNKSNGCSFEVNGNILTVTPFYAITETGEYALKIPAGLITRVADASDVVVDGDIVFVVTVPEGIEAVAADDDNAVIYDLTGRRIAEIVKPGIYIVNGKKVLVK